MGIKGYVRGVGAIDGVAGATEEKVLTEAVRRSSSFEACESFISSEKEFSMMSGVSNNFIHSL